MTLQPIIIDDDDIICFIVKKLLATCNYPAGKSFTSAIQGLDYISKEQNTETEFLIFLDINMPVMNGWQFIAEMEKLNLKSQFSIFIITSSIDPADKEKAKTYNIVMDYFEKPLRTDVFEMLKKNDRLKKFF